MVITFLGTKGGTGTTTLAVNSAAELCRVSGQRVLVIDLKAGSGDVGLFLGLRSRYSLLDLLDQSGWLDPAVVPSLLSRHECGLDVLVAADDFARPSPADAPGIERVMELLRRAYDFIVIDAGSALSSCSATALHASDQVMLVANPDVPCLRNLQRLRDMVRLIGIPEERLRVVLNRTSDVEVLTVSQIEDALGRHIDHRFTSDYRTVAAALNTGVPVAWVRPSILKGEFERFARGLVGSQAGTPHA
ncbi:MAG: AAA family ATPase [Vicinamibacterales bacterium]|nr:AAA family ATPase [Vicinamibacterales bacterium]